MSPEAILGCPDLQVSTEKVADLPEILRLSPLAVKINGVPLVVYEHSSMGFIRPYDVFFRFSPSREGSCLILPSSLTTPGEGLRARGSEEGCRISFSAFGSAPEIFFSVSSAKYSSYPGFASVSTLVERKIVKVDIDDRFSFERPVLIPAPRGKTDKRKSATVLMIEGNDVEPNREKIEGFLRGRGLWRPKIIP